MGPAYAIPKTLKWMEKDGIRRDDIAVIELHEAFASSAVGTIKVLGLNKDIININGGSLSLGHPLGATAARIVGSCIRELQRQGKKYGLVSACIGTGMGNAAVIELLN
jgi:acetyl-CoA acyltransferase